MRQAGQAACDLGILDRPRRSENSDYSGFALWFSLAGHFADLWKEGGDGCPDTSFWRQDMDDLSGFCCQNTQCPDYGKRGLGNLKVCDRIGKDNRLRLLQCRTCKARFSERKGTPLFRAHLSEKEILALGSHLAEGCGVRKTERLTGVARNTVIRYSRLLGAHSKALHDELVGFSPRHARGSV
jgi:LacI family transcriptional regulator